MPEIDPQEEQKETPIRNSKGKRKKLRVGVYFSSIEEAEEYAEAAVKAGFRRGGLPVIKKKEHGWGGEVLMNGDGIAKYLKWRHNQGAAQDKVAEGLKAMGGLKK